MGEKWGQNIKMWKPLTGWNGMLSGMWETEQCEISGLDVIGEKWVT